MHFILFTTERVIRMRIGVVNWDCSLPPNTFFGSYFAKTMSFKKWRERTPYYADIISEDNICCHYRTAEEYDLELKYAIEAKIDYFAYVWHTDDKNAKPDPNVKTTVTRAHAWTQDYVRKFHQRSDLAKKIKLCAILLCSHPYTESDYFNLSEAMKASYYEKVGEKPIVYLFGGYRTDIIDRLRAFPQKYGTSEPFIVFMNNGVESENGDYSKADAVTAYACAAGNIDKYSELVDVLISENEKRKKYNIDILPLFSVGWDPTPRIETSVPWVSYRNIKYSQGPTPNEIEEGARRLTAWIDENSEYTKTDHILTFAWNEFEEGSYICPTYNADNSINSERISGFSNAVRIFKKEI